MYSYRLDNSKLDKIFLDGQPVTGRAVVKLRDVLTPGQTIVVVLSTGAKYKAVIKSFESAPIGGYTVGDLEIIRT
jgi:hypothetical protein